MTQRAPFRPTVQQVVFSLKTFSAAMLAYYIALRFDLPRPFWAVVTVYVVAHPLTGVTTSKAHYRLFGTIIGGIATVILVPLLVASPFLLTLAIGTWIGLCLFFSLLDPTPRSYVFMLAGYTLAITGFMLTSTPEDSFLYAVSRVEEIGIGLVCSAVINRVVLPLPAGDVVLRQITAWMTDATRLTIDSLDLHSNAETTLKDRQKLAADVRELGQFISHLSYDTSKLNNLADLVRLLQWRMTRLLPSLSTLHDRMMALKSDQGCLSKDIQQLIRQVALWVKSTGETNTPERDVPTTRQLRQAITAIEQRHCGQNWCDLLTVNFCQHLRLLIKSWTDCASLHKAIIGNKQQRRFRWQRSARLLDRARHQHRDYGMAFLSAITVVIATSVATLFWIASGWREGVGIAQLAAIFCCLFATLDDPVPLIRKFATFTALSIAIAACYQLAIFPRVDSFLTLSAALGLSLIPAGLLVAMPAFSVIGAIVSVNIPMALTLQSHLNADFATFANANIATLIGFAIAGITTAIVRSIGAETSAKRLLKNSWHDLEKLATAQRLEQIRPFSQRQMDRLALMVPRLAVLPPDSSLAASDFFRDLRMGLNMMELHKHKKRLSPDLLRRIDEILSCLAAHYQNKRHEGYTHPEDDSHLVRLLDQTLAESFRFLSPRSRVVQALIGLRRGLDALPPICSRTTAEKAYS
nr:FUSC family protein [uncultured Desulfuromonas sp.]